MDSVGLASRGEGYCWNHSLLSLFASVLSVSGLLCQDEPLFIQSSSHSPSEDKAKTKKGNVFSSNDGRSYIFLWGSMAVKRATYPSDGLDTLISSCLMRGGFLVVTWASDKAQGNPMPA